MQYPVAKIRAQDYTEANKTWSILTRNMANIPTNGIVGDPPGKMITAMEGLGAIGIVDELLLQSHTGTITLFPQVPPGEPASFRSLRARGGFLVSAAMPTGQRDKISGVAIVSEVGGTATLRTPWSCKNVHVTAMPGGKVATKSAAPDTISWDTAAGVSYSVACAGGPLKTDDSGGRDEE